MKMRSGYLIVAGPLMGLFMACLMQVRSFALQGVEPAYIRKVRSIRVGKLGLEHPAGLAFMRDAGSFVVLDAPRDNQTRLFLMTSYKEVIRVVSAEVGIIDPTNIVFDSRFNRLLAFETASNDLLDLEAAPDGSLQGLLRIKTRSRMKRLGLQRTRGMAIDPATGDLYILDSSGMRIVSIRPDENGDLDVAAALNDGRVSYLSLARKGLVEPRGLAFNPDNSHLYFLSASEQKVYELTRAGLVVASLDLAPFGLANPQGMVFAPSGDPTDDPSNISLYIADTGMGAQPTKTKSGQIVEFTLTAPAALDAAVPTVPGNLVRRTDTWRFSPPSPDPAGVAYLSGSGTLLISDSEVDQLSNLFTGMNLYEVSLSGSLIRTLTTVSFSNEPTGIACDPGTRKLFISDDDQYRVFILDPGPDASYNTSDDKLASFSTSAFGSYDPEDVTFDSWRGHVLVMDGTAMEVYDVSPGPNGVFDGATTPGDDVVTHFDTAAFGITDPEGIFFNPDDSHLYILSQGARKIAETTLDGTLLRYIDISSINSVAAAGLTYAPASSGIAGEKSFYIVDRGVDNGENPSENDGELYEITLNAPVPATTTLSPTTVTARGTAFALTVNGSGFTNASVVRWNDSDRPSTYVSSTRLTAAIPASDIAASGSAQVTVFNPPPAGGTSNAQALTIKDPSAPTLSGLNPLLATSGTAAFTLAATGTGFVTDSIVRWNGTNRATTFVSTTRLNVAIPASDVATAGTFPVTVYTPTPGGGTSNSKTFYVQNPLPTTTGLSPSAAATGGPAFTLAVDGTNFVADSAVRWNGTNRASTFVSSTRLTATIPASDIASVGTAQVTVYSPTKGGGGGTSNAQTFTIGSAQAPTITSLSPASASAGGAAFTLTVTGSNFGSGSVVRWNGVDRTTTLVSATQLTAAIAAADITTAGSAQVTVFTSGGGTSNSQTFTINNPAPATTGLNPTSATAGGAAFTLTVTGTNFVNNSVVRWNGADRTTTFVSATQLTAAIPAADIASAGNAQVTVFNQGPGGGTSNAQTLTINNVQAPTITGLSPTSATAGGPSFTLTVNGTNFVSGAIVRWNGVDRTTTFVSATQLTAAIPATDIATAGTAQVTVFASGAGTSNPQTFTINNPAPTVMSLSPASAAAGGAAFTLTVNGTNFVNGSAVLWNGSNRNTTFVSSIQLTASIPASDIAVAGTAPVTVFNPSPGGGTSNAQTFTINSIPAPAITNLSPASATAGGPSFTLTVNGTNFVSGAIVRWNGSDRSTTFVSTTQLTAAIPAADIATAGIAQVTVFASGTGTSNPQTFTINNAQGPTITSLSPTAVNARGAAFTLTINGTGFTASSVVRWNGIDRTGTYLSSTRLRTTVSAAEIAVAATVQLTVFTPGAGGGLSNTQTLTIQNPPAPTITDRNPLLATVGSPAFTLTVSGTDFVSDSVVRWNGADRPTTFVSATKLTVAIPASDISTPGTLPVTVYTPLPGGGTSNAKNFYVQNPVPTTTSLTPATAAAGGAAFTLTVDGTNFVTDSVVRWNGANRTTTFVSSSRLTATISASDIALAGAAQVTVYSPTRGGGGGTSNARTFTISP